MTARSTMRTESPSVHGQILNYESNIYIYHFIEAIHI